MDTILKMTRNLDKLIDALKDQLGDHDPTVDELWKVIRRIERHALTRDERKVNK